MSQPGIAVVAPNWLGDAVLCLPALEALRRAFPHSRIAIHARRSVAPVFSLTGLDLEVESLPEPPSLRVAPSAAEVVVILPNSFYSALVGLRLGGRQRIGFAGDGRRWLLRPAIERPRREEIRPHESFRYLELLRRAGLIAAIPAEDVHVPLHPAPQAVAAWRARFHQPPVGMHVGAAFGTAKRWLPERFAALARAVADAGRPVALIGSGSERELAADVARAADRPKLVSDLAGQTSLPELTALLAGACALVANDSGPMHLAAAVGTPVVALFGSTNERETYPVALPGRLRMVKVAGVACSPCKLRECPIDHPCMTGLSVAAVWQALEGFLHG